MTTRERNRYELSLKNHRDMLADKETTRVRLKEAIKEGRAEGCEQERLENVRALKSSVMLTNEQIANILHLSIEEVESL